VKRQVVVSKQRRAGNEQTDRPEIDPPVLGAAFFGAVAGDRVLLTVPLRLQAAGINAQLLLTMN
jgi:hypothetical protein